MSMPNIHANLYKAVNHRIRRYRVLPLHSLQPWLLFDIIPAAMMAIPPIRPVAFQTTTIDPIPHSLSKNPIITVKKACEMPLGMMQLALRKFEPGCAPGFYNDSSCCALCERDAHCPDGFLIPCPVLAKQDVKDHEYDGIRLGPEAPQSSPNVTSSIVSRRACLRKEHKRC